MLSLKRLILSAVGVAIIVGVFAVIKTTVFPASTSDFTEAQEFTGIVQWLNSEPLKLEELRGRVVLLDFWTYSCINCLRPLPYMRDWDAKYSSKGLTIVGVHSPEFAFEKVASNVRLAIIREGIAWPVAMDNDFATWYSYGTRWWPHKFLIDQKGNIRYQHLGEGAYRETELQIRGLLIEAGYDVSDIPVGDLDLASGSGATTREVYAGLSWSSSQYLGNDLKASGISGISGLPASFVDPEDREDSRFYLHGVWTLNEERVRHGRTTEGFEDYLAIQYREASVDAGLQPAGRKSLKVEVTLDLGPVPEDMRGGDIQLDPEGRTFLVVDTHRLYNLIRGSGAVTHELRLSAAAPDFSLYNFTFGPRKWSWATLDQEQWPEK